MKKRFRSILSILLVLIFGITFMNISSYASGGATAHSLSLDGFEVSYTAAENGTLEKVSTAPDIGSGVYLLSLPSGAVLTSVSYTEALNIVTKNDLESGSNSLSAFPDESLWMENADFNQPVSGSSYEMFRSLVASDYQLPQEDVKGFLCLSDSSFQLLFIQISTVASGGATAHSLSLDGFEVSYTAAENGTLEKVSTAPDIGSGVYLLSLPSGAVLTSVSYTEALNIVTKNDLESGSNSLSAFPDESLWMENADFNQPVSGSSYEMFRSLVASDYQLPQEDVKGFLCLSDSSFQLLFIQISTVVGSTSTVNKVNLAAQIARVTGERAADWHQSGDRFNGTIPPSTVGYWAELISEDGPLENALKVYNNPNTTQNKVDAATDTLSDAIAKLIPITQLNATRLYEILQTERNQYLFTPNSWAVYESARADAQAYLNSLFENGIATAENISANQDKADAYVVALEEAIAGLDGITGEDTVSNAQMAYDSLKALANKIYHPSALSEEKYSAASWEAFLTAWNTANDFLTAHVRPETGIGQREAEACVNAYADFWDVCYKGLAAREAGTAEIHVIDHYSQFASTTISDCYKGTYQVNIPAGGLRMAQVLKTILPDGHNSGNILKSGMVNGGIGIYVNGIYLFKMPETKSYTANPSTHPNAYTYQPLWDADLGSYITEGTDDSIRVNAGDIVIVVLMQLPTEVNASGSVGPMTASAALPYVQYTEIRQGSETYAEVIEAASGEEIGLNVIYRLAVSAGYSGGTQPKSGAKVFISAACGSEAEARSAAANVDTGLVTDADGSFTLQLYSAENSTEAWYVLNVLDLSKYGPLANGANVLIHVKDSEDLAELKSDLKDKLTTLRNAHGDEFYNAAQLEQVNTVYTQGMAGIDAAANSGEANAAYEAARQTISDIQEYNENAVAYHLNAVRWALPYLPDLAELQDGKLYEVDRPVLEFLFADGTGIFSTEFSAYEKIQLTGSELALLEALQAAYEGGNLVATPSFTVTYTLVDEATGESWTKPINRSSIEAYLGKEVDWITGENWWESIPAWRAQSMEIHSVENEELLSANGLSHINLRVSLVASLSEIQALTYTITKAEDDLADRYESDIYVAEEGYVTTWKLEAFPRQDVHITIYLKDKGEADPAESYLAQLKTAFNSYQRNDYSAANWERLVEAYNNGVAKIREAADNDARQAELDVALLAMEGIEKQSSTGGDTIPNWGVGDAFDAGRQVGTVSLSVENSTFPGGAFYNGGDPLFVEPEYPIGENDTMMTVILRALADAGYTWDDGHNSGFGISYIANICKGDQKMGQFSGETGSGWMGSLNDFMVNEGFPGFSVANRQLADGDEIRFMFTQNLGVDLGGSWGNSNTTLKSLETSNGTIVPAFTPGEEGGSYSFALLISSDTASIKLTPTAANKNYMAKTFLNEKVTSNDEGNSFYRRTESIVVHAGDIVYVGVGEPAWPSMNKTGA